MNKHLLTMAAGLLFCTGQAFAQESVEKTFDCVADTWIRSDKATSNNGSTNNMEIHKKDDTNSFYGLIGFDFSVPEGMKVESATLHLVTGVCRKAEMGVYVYGNDFAENTNYNNELSYVEKALAENPITTFIPAGQNGKALYDSGLNETNQTLSAWVNDVDITDYVRSLSFSTLRINFLIAQAAEDNTAKITFYSKDNTGESAAQFDGLKNLTHDDLTPELIVIFVEDTNSASKTLEPTADTFVRSSAADKNYGSLGDMEIYWKEGTDEGTRDPQFYGLMSFNLPADVLDGSYEITSARLRLVTTQCKGDRKMGIYKYPSTFDETGAKWNTESDKVAQALSDTPIATFEAKGQNTKRMDNGGITDAYKNVEAWTNYIDLTDYLKANPENLNILITREKSNTTNNDAMKIATKEAQDYVNTATDSANPFTFKAEDLKPQLYIAYTKKGSDIPTGIENIAEEDVDAPVEYYTLQGIRVENPGHGLYIVKKGNKVTKIVL